MRVKRPTNRRENERWQWITSAAFAKECSEDIIKIQRFARQYLWRCKVRACLLTAIACVSQVSTLRTQRSVQNLKDTLTCTVPSWTLVGSSKLNSEIKVASNSVT